MGPKAHFIFALVFFLLGRRSGDHILYFFSIYGLIIGISALVHRISLPKEEIPPSEKA
jgi:hypothetical protein